MKRSEKSHIAPYAAVEVIFDTGYLVFAIASGIILLIAGQERGLPVTLFGLLSLLLGLGDLFHLLPRIYGQMSGRMKALTKALGMGKLVTSVTMTVFYLLLYGVWLAFYAVPAANPVTVVLCVLVAVRVIFILCPQNRWLSGGAPIRWAVYRNIPFLAVGVIVAFLFAQTSAAPHEPFRFMPVAIAVSFLCYLPVVLFSSKKPQVGALMLPKTAAYIWMICMGLQLL